MTPSTGTMAILLGESFSSRMSSSNLGPTVRVGAAAPFRTIRTKCKGLNTRVITSKQAKNMAAIFQPRAFGGGGTDAASRGGGERKGGGGRGFVELDGGTL